MRARMAARLWMTLVMGASIREIAHCTYGLVRSTAVIEVTELCFSGTKQQKRPLEEPDFGIGYGSKADVISGRCHVAFGQ